MAYVPNTEADRREMLREIGASSIEELFDDIPDELKLDGEVDVPGPLSEQELVRHLGRLAGMNRTADDVLSFLLDDFYPRSGAALSCAHPGFIVDHAFERCRFDGRAPSLSVEVVREASLNLELVEG